MFLIPPNHPLSLNEITKKRREPPKKNPRILSIESWLFTRPPYNGLLSPIEVGMMSSTYPKQPRGPFFHEAQLYVPSPSFKHGT